MNILAQILGIGAMVSLFMIYQQKTRKGILISKLSADAFWVAHYLCLGGYAGLIPNAVGIFRELIFMHRKNKKWAGLIIWPIIFVIINWVLGFRTFNSWFNILPIAGSTCVTIALWIDNPRLTKAICLPVSVCFMIYDFFIGSYIGIVNEAIGITSIIIFFVKEFIKERAKK